MEIKLLLLGNGFEANFNEKMSNFNEVFRKWIINLSDNDIFDLIDNISLSIFNELNMLENKAEIIIEVIKELKEEYVNESDYEELLIEDILFKMGSKIKRDYIFEDDSEKIEDIFLSIKYLFGYFIDSNTIKECEYFKNNFNDFPIKMEKPNFLITTNYTNSVMYLAEKMKQGIYKGNTEIIYLHGKFENGISKYNSIEINLVDKNVKKHFEKIESQLSKKSNKIDQVTFDIFGHNLAKDNHIILSILDLFWKIKKTAKINFIYYNEEDKTSLIEVFQKIAENTWEYRFQNNSLSKFDTYGNEENIKINFVNYIEYKLWIWLEGQKNK